MTPPFSNHILLPPRSPHPSSFALLPIFTDLYGATKPRLYRLHLCSKRPCAAAVMQLLLSFVFLLIVGSASGLKVTILSAAVLRVSWEASAASSVTVTAT